MIVHTESGYALSGVFSTLAKAYTYMEMNHLSEDRYEVQLEDLWREYQEILINLTGGSPFS